MQTWLVLSMCMATIGAGIAWLFAAVSARHSAEAIKASQKLLSAVSAIADLELATARNNETLRKLQGMVYKKKQQDAEASEPTPTGQYGSEWKRRMREKYGLTPRAK